MVFQIVIKNNVMKNIKDIKIRDQELLDNLLYNTSVVSPVIHKKIEMKLKIIILLETTTVIDIIKISTHKIITDLVLDKDITIDLQVHTHLDPDMTIIIEEELHPDLHLDHHTETTPIIDIIHDQDIDLVLNHTETLLDDTITHIDLHLDQEITDHDLEHPLKTDHKMEQIK